MTWHNQPKPELLMSNYLLPGKFPNREYHHRHLRSRSPNDMFVRIERAKQLPIPGKNHRTEYTYYFRYKDRYYHHHCKRNMHNWYKVLEIQDLVPIVHITFTITIVNVICTIGTRS